MQENVPRKLGLVKGELWYHSRLKNALASGNLYIYTKKQTQLHKIK